MRLGVLAFAAVVVATAGQAQTQYGETVNVTVVEVPVTVVDRSGNPVKNLTREQFEVFVDGKKVALTGFETINLTEIDLAPPTTPIPPAAYRDFLLLFDLSGSTPGTLKRAQTAATEFVTTQLKRRDLVAVATFSVEKGLDVITSFTSDREFLLHAIATLGNPSYIKAPDALKLAVSSESRLKRKPTKTRSEEDMPDEIARQKAMEFNAVAQKAHEEDLRGRLRKQVRQFGILARMLDRVPGRKQIVLLSEGFDPTAVEGTQDRSPVGTREQNEALERAEVWKVTTEQRYGSATASSEIQAMGELFRRSDVLLHAIDIKGLRSSVDASAGLQESSNQGLHWLTRPTGGSVFENATDLRQSFSQMLRQQDLVYVLAFETQRTFTPGLFHEITVKVPAARGGRVTHRAGFYETSPYPPTPVEQTFSLASLLMSDEEKSDVPFVLTASPLPSQERVPILVETSGPGLLKNGDENVVTADLYIYAFDAKNQVQDSLQQRLAIDLTRNAERLREGDLRFVSSLLLPPGRYTVKALLRVEESGRVGVIRRVIDVPEAKISATFLRPVKKGINVTVPGAGDVALAAFGASVPVLHPTLHGPTSVAVFGGAVDADLARFAAPMDGPKPALRIVDSRDDRVLLELDPAGLQSGEYKLLLGPVTLPFRVE